MTDLELTVRLAAAAGVDARAAVTAMLEPLAPVLTEWSFNDGDDPRGAFRFGSWSDDHERAGAVVDQLGQARCAALRARLPLDAMEGLGLAWAPGRAPTFRWWLLAPSDGDALHDAAVAAVPGLADDAAALAAACGGRHRCTAVGLELSADGDALLRSTIYVAVPDPAAALAVLARIGCPPSAAANRFFRGLCGLGPERPRPWPKLWFGRSVGASAGWKAYYFARRDPDRPDDAVLLDAIDATPQVQQAAAAISDAAGGGPAVQLLGLVFRDGALDRPAWTTYLATR